MIIKMFFTQNGSSMALLQTPFCNHFFLKVNGDM